jgi:ABC-type phosphate transport system auxiliary subunit
MNPNEDEDFSFDEPNDATPVMRELRIEMVRLQAQIDQLAASARERAVEIAELRVRLNDLELRLNGLKTRHRQTVQLWVWIALLYGTAIGMGFSYLMRP